MDKREEVHQEIVALLEGLTDEQRLSCVDLHDPWQIGESYAAGDVVLFGGTLYRCLQTHTAQEDWTPDAAPSLWAKILIPDPEIIPEWEQPDSTNAYMQGDKVAHNGKTWVSSVDNNVWEPGVVGTETLWKEIVND